MTEEELLDPTQMLAIALANYRWDAAHIHLRTIPPVETESSPERDRIIAKLAQDAARRIVGTPTDGNEDIAEAAVIILTERLLARDAL